MLKSNLERVVLHLRHYSFAGRSKFPSCFGEKRAGTHNYSDSRNKRACVHKGSDDEIDVICVIFRAALGIYLALCDGTERTWYEGGRVDNRL
jgi:hypothetical protein